MEMGRAGFRGVVCVKFSKKEKVLEQIGKELSENTVGCRARYFYRVMTENGLGPSIVADYGNWCRKGGSGPVQDTFD
jgi:hypothetical protein